MKFAENNNLGVLFSKAQFLRVLSKKFAEKTKAIYLKMKDPIQNIQTIMPSKINTERLSLDLLSVQDDAFILELVNTPGWLTFIGDRNIHSTEDAIAYINKINSTPHFTYWTVRLKQSYQPLGVITFLKRSYLPHFDIGFAFLPKHCRQGYAYEAAKEVLSIVKRVPEHRVVLATTIPGNIKSVKLLTKLGFHYQNEIEEGGKALHVYSTVDKTD